MSSGGMSKAALSLYQGAGQNRSLAQERQLHRLAATNQVEKTDLGWLICSGDFADQKYLVINRQLNFAHIAEYYYDPLSEDYQRRLQHNRDRNIHGVISLDGSLTGREGVVSDDLSYEKIFQRCQKLLSSLPAAMIDIVSLLIESTRRQINIAKTIEEKRINLISFSTELKISLENNRELMCVPLYKFGVGKCRHLALDLAISMGVMVKLGKLAAQPIHMFRYTAYNQNAHTWVMYEYSDTELYLIDPTLTQGSDIFNIKNKEGLIAAIETYNNLELNGLLVDLVRHYQLATLLSVEEYEALFDVEAISPAILELLKADEDSEFNFAKSYLSQNGVSSPVRLSLVGSNGVYCSEEIYDQDEINYYIDEMLNNPFYPKTHAVDPLGSGAKIVGLVVAKEVKEKLLNLIVQKSIVARPEEFSGTLWREETARRKQQRLQKAINAAKQQCLKEFSYEEEQEKLLTWDNWRKRANPYAKSEQVIAKSRESEKEKSEKGLSGVTRMSIFFNSDKVEFTSINNSMPSIESAGQHQHLESEIEAIVELTGGVDLTELNMSRSKLT